MVKVNNGFAGNMYYNNKIDSYRQIERNRIEPKVYVRLQRNCTYLNGPETNHIENRQIDRQTIDGQKDRQIDRCTSLNGLGERNSTNVTKWTETFHPSIYSSLMYPSILSIHLNIYLSIYSSVHESLYQCILSNMFCLLNKIDINALYLSFLPPIRLLPVFIIYIYILYIYIHYLSIYLGTFLSKTRQK